MCELQSFNKDETDFILKGTNSSLFIFFASSWSGSWRCVRRRAGSCRSTPTRFSSRLQTTAQISLNRLSTPWRSHADESDLDTKPRLSPETFTFLCRRNCWGIFFFISSSLTPPLCPYTPCNKLSGPGVLFGLTETSILILTDRLEKGSQCSNFLLSPQSLIQSRNCLSA